MKRADGTIVCDTCQGVGPDNIVYILTERLPRRVDQYYDGNEIHHLCEPCLHLRYPDDLFYVDIGETVQIIKKKTP